MANILILGAGAMGTAFSYPCSDKNHSVTVVGSHLEDDFIDLINSKKKHIEIKHNVILRNCVNLVCPSKINIIIER